ncbi:hypothetical protein [Neobacillus mesonae]|uniref:hypothetical protein n=1 Tax=Neobacillus mesonae TaxID=1193713 RepID=UPI002040A19D|nr:hypothetical protein [Neobacillus mesonae]MCM3570240.1 hypothetical protein [Neobacillus mesonae]
MERTVKANTIGSSTIKRNGAIVKGTKGKRIAHLSNLKEDVSIAANRKKTHA